MTIEIKLFANEKETADGFPLAVLITHKRNRKRKNIGFCKFHHFIQDGKTISSKHPDYDILAPIIMEIKIRAKKIIYKGITDVDQAYNELFSVDFSQVLLLDFARKYIGDMKAIAEGLGKSKDLKAKNKILGNVKVYENVVAQFEPFGKNVSLQNLDYEILMRFRNYHLGLGNSKSTIHLYLRTLRSIYNKGISMYKLHDEKPFAKVFAGLKTKSYDTKKKYLDKEGVLKLEAIQLTTAKQKYIDLFLLSFYFGGCDLIDLYYLNTKQLRRGRVLFERSKTNTGTRIDLKIHPKAQKIIDRYKTEGEWLFAWPKEKEAYETFRRTYQRGLIYIQELYGIEVLPNGGNIGSKVARHTFANLAKRLRIEPDVIRELMGHERDQVDNYYKDVYPERVRDDALFEIISSFECVR